MMVTLRRMEADLMATRALVHASLSPDAKPDPTIKAFQEYADKALPFLATAQDGERKKERDTLLAFTKLKARINTRSIYKQQAEKLKKHASSALSRFKLRPKMPGL